MVSTRSQEASSYFTSLTLVARAQANDQAAWQRLVDLYGPLIFSWGCRGGLSAEDSADVMQEVFASVAKAIARFDPTAQGRFRGWLWTITRNKICDHHRRSADQPLGKGGDTALRRMTQLPEQWDDHQSEVTEDEIRSLCHRALELIRPDFQPHTFHAFWLCVIDGKPTDEVAAEVGLTSNGVRQAKSRVLRRLRAELSDEDLPS
ncbi:MAG: sigma-70 family RNA polymerase sigma factor [Pirellulales bacterium]|nr:sigma-70 family RNA polymerase sigma factor [Pirellulales bacterium]